MNCCAAAAIPARCASRFPRSGTYSYEGVGVLCDPFRGPNFELVENAKANLNALSRKIWSVLSIDFK